MAKVPSFRIVKVLACLKDHEGMKKLVTLTEWSGRKAKMDIRWWLADGRPGKGVTFDDEEAAALLAVLKKALKN